MIVFDQVTATAAIFARHAQFFPSAPPVLSSVNLAIPSDRRIALFCPSDQDGRIFINILCGSMVPQSGRVIKTVSVSFPVGHIGSFNTDLSVRSNIVHLARLYDMNVEAMLDFIKRVSGVGASFDKPFGALSEEVRTRLARILGFTVPFDVYVLNDRCVWAGRKPGDVLHSLLMERLRTAGMIISTKNVKLAQEYCDMALVLGAGELHLYNSVDEALVALRELKGRVRRQRSR